MKKWIGCQRLVHNRIGRLNERGALRRKLSDALLPFLLKRSVLQRHVAFRVDIDKVDDIILEALGRSLFAPQIRRLSLGAVDADTFYINRAGKTLPKTQRARLERAKVELKHQFVSE